MLALDGLPIMELLEVIVHLVGGEREAKQLADAVGDLLGSQAQAKMAVLEPQHAHRRR
ncbi:MAG TPA: hypothetical protein VMG37_06975 [Solirubrobacteraceae bacterium]|nr:hypothetical protein [Solirubrobacteraceae bacterium]